MQELTARCHASFVIDTLEFLYKGGRCSALAMLGANLLQLKPCIEVNPADGSMNVGKKYRGSLDKALSQYVRGVPIYGENGFEKCTSPEAIKSVNFIKELVDKKLLVSELENSIYPGFTWADNNFANGEAVFLDSRQWTAQGCGSQLAALGLSMGLVPWPRPDDMAADDPRYQQVSTPNDSFILLKGVSEEQSRSFLSSWCRPPLPTVWWNFRSTSTIRTCLSSASQQARPTPSMPPKSTRRLNSSAIISREKMSR